MFMSKLKDLPNNFLFPLQSPSPHRAAATTFPSISRNDAVECSGSGSGARLQPLLISSPVRLAGLCSPVGRISALNFRRRELSPRFDGKRKRRDFRGKKGTLGRASSRRRLRPETFIGLGAVAVDTRRWTGFLSAQWATLRAATIRHHQS